MTIFEAQQYDPAKTRRRRNIIVFSVLGVILIAALAWNFRYWSEERAVDKFFAALQAKDFEKAYGIWWNDPGWKQHPEKYKDYTFNNFQLDWGPGGYWGHIQNYEVEGAQVPKAHGASRASGVVVVVTVNGRSEKCNIWVEKDDKTLTFSPF